MTLFWIAFSLFLVMNSVGSIPIYVSFLKGIPPTRQYKIIFRELIIALIIIIIFNFAGSVFLEFLRIDQNTISIAGGIILFLLALKMVFPPEKKELRLKKIKERHRFMKGLFSWVGYSQKTITYQREPRCVGKTKWNFLRLWNLALEGFTSFSIAPLKIASYLGLFTAFGALIYAIWVIYKTLMYGDPVKGYPSLMVVILFLGGIQLIAIGVIGEYLGRVFNETKQRPLYLINDYYPAENRPKGPIEKKNLKNSFHVT